MSPTDVQPPSPFLPNRLLAVLLLFCVVPLSCSLLDFEGVGKTGTEVQPGVETEYAGYYTQGFEDSIFEPCLLDEDWQLTGAEGEDSPIISLVRRVGELDGHNPVFVRLRGTASTKGTFQGIFITYDRTFNVTEVEEVREIKARDCL